MTKPTKFAPYSRRKPVMSEAERKRLREMSVEALPKVLRTSGVLMEKRDARALLTLREKIAKGQRYITLVSKAKGTELTPALWWGESQTRRLVKQFDDLWLSYEGASPLKAWGREIGIRMAYISVWYDLDKLKTRNSIYAYSGLISKQKYWTTGAEKTSIVWSGAVEALLWRESSLWESRSKLWNALKRLLLKRYLAELNSPAQLAWEASMLTRRTRKDEPYKLGVNEHHLALTCEAKCAVRRWVAEGHIPELRPHFSAGIYSEVVHQRALRIVAAWLQEAMFVVERGYRPYTKQDRPNYLEPPHAHLIPGWSAAGFKDIWGTGEYVQVRRGDGHGVPWWEQAPPPGYFAAKKAQ